MRKESRRRLVLLFCTIWMFFIGGEAGAYPSTLQYEGSAVVWNIGTTTIWRFPVTSAAEVTQMSDRFNALYRKGFKLPDLHVAKKDKQWALCLRDQILFNARPEYAVSVKQNTYVMSLQWMSRLYEAIGRLHAQELTPKYKLQGGFQISSSVSWYGGKFIGRKFANGERFTEGHLSAAAKNLPFGTLVRVTTPATGKSVVVRITDRFMEHKNRALDLSHAAAEILGIKGMGVAKAKLEVIGRVDAIGGK